ncbi:MAG: hypothetical protein ACEPOV_05165 [Hyphomicrobiales bacterium]
MSKLMKESRSSIIFSGIAFAVLILFFDTFEKKNEIVSNGHILHIIVLILLQFLYYRRLVKRLKEKTEDYVSASFLVKLDVYFVTIGVVISSLYMIYGSVIRGGEYLNYIIDGIMLWVVSVLINFLWLRVYLRKQQE